MINLNIPNLDHKDENKLLEAIKSGWISSAGPDIKKFENEFAEFVGSKYAIACASGTAALHVCLSSLRIGNNSDVITPALSFIATANAIKYLGASTVFVDIEDDTLAIDFKKAKKFILKNYKQKNGKYINNLNGNSLDAVVPVHMLGSPFRLKELRDFANEFKLDVVIDSAEALGAEHEEGRVGSDEFMNCFSFNGNKIITSGGGGMITTNSEAISNRLKHLTTTAKTDPVFFVHDEVGYNYRLVNLLAALGRSQLSKANAFLEKKRYIHNFYKTKLSEINIEIFSEPIGLKSNYWLNLAMFPNEVLKNYDLINLVKYFSKRNVEVRPMWSIISTLEPYKNSLKDNLDVTKSIWSRGLCIPSSTTLTDEDLKIVISAIKDLYQ